MNLLAVEYSWIADVVLLGILLIGLVAGMARGFIRGICKLGGTIAALIVAFMFCVPLAGYLEGLGAINWLVDLVKNGQVAYWITVGAAFIILTLLTKLVAFILGKIGKAIIQTSKVLTFIDRALGALLGMAMALLFVGIVFALFNLVKITAVIEYIEAGKVTNWLYNWTSNLLESVLA